MVKLQSEEEKKIIFLIIFTSVSRFLLKIELETLEIPTGQFVGQNWGKHCGVILRPLRQSYFFIRGHSSIEMLIQPPQKCPASRRLLTGVVQAKSSGFVVKIMSGPAAVLAYNPLSGFAQKIEWYIPNQYITAALQHRKTAVNGKIIVHTFEGTPRKTLLCAHMLLLTSGNT